MPPRNTLHPGVEFLDETFGRFAMQVSTTKTKYALWIAGVHHSREEQQDCTMREKCQWNFLYKN